MIFSKRSVIANHKVNDYFKPFLFSSSKCSNYYGHHRRCDREQNGLIKDWVYTPRVPYWWCGLPSEILNTV